MIHELLIILSGHPSPLFTPTLPATFPLVSQAERELLNSLASLGNIHISLRQQCSQIVSSHRSIIARAIASGIDAHHLQHFRDQVVRVEASVLTRESGVVGGYDIVALSKILSEFEGWDRILQYLDGLTTLMLGGLSSEDEGDWVRGAQLINRLRKDIHTGYPSLEQVALHLLQVAETTWLRQISTWVLYGRLPTFGSEDFFIKEKEGVAERIGDSGVLLTDYIIDKALLPEFVTPETASSILFIGRSLSHVRIRGASPYTQFKALSNITPTPVTAELGLLPTHLPYLQSLRSPLSPQKFSASIAGIRLSLSRHTLQTLLPAHKIVEVLYVLREFFLLGRGEFAIALVAQADERVRNRHRGKGQTAPLVSSSSSVLLKEGEVSAVLTRTWGILASFQSEEVLDERLELAREVIYLSLHKQASTQPFPSAKKPISRDNTKFSDLLVGAPVSLNYDITWPMELFLTPSDIDKYDRIFHYLISSKKCLIKLQSLWHGRRHPVPMHGLVHDRVESKKRRELLKRREQRERFIWSTAGLVVFFLETLGSYWQGEVIEPSFNRLITILGGSPEVQKRKRARSKFSKQGLDGMDVESEDAVDSDEEMVDGSMDVNEPEEQQQDPESLAKAHRLFLTFLLRSLFLSDTTFPSLYRNLLETCGTLCTWISRLEKLHSLADLGVDSTANSPEEESQVTSQMSELNEACENIRRLLSRLVERLHGMDEERSKGGGGLVGLLIAGEAEDGSGGGGKIDRLLMRLNWDSMGGGGDGTLV
ncbi:gamma-tubulin complex component protein [Peziza echinospora]|nr:gamma-tubulin complex component protein [Peziza echinospora]